MPYGPLTKFASEESLLTFLPLESIGLNITVTKSNGHRPWKVGRPQGWSSSLKSVIIGDVLESLRLNNMLTMSMASWTTRGYSSNLT